MHDEHQEVGSLAFALSRISHTPHGPTPIGIFRDVERPVYDELMSGQLETATAERGAGDLESLIHAATPGSSSRERAGEPVAGPALRRSVSGAAPGELVIAAKTVELIRAIGPDQPVATRGPDDSCSGADPITVSPVEGCLCRGPGRDACDEPTARPCVRPWSLRNLQERTSQLNRRDQLLDVLDFEKSALVLVMRSPGIRSPALRRLAVAEVEEVWLFGSSMSSQSEHGWTLR